MESALLAQVCAITQQQKISFPTPDVAEQAGSAVALTDDWLAIGVPRNLVPGAVRMYRRDDGGTPADFTDDIWLFSQQLEPADPEDGVFGGAVAIDDDSLIVGAIGGDPPGAPNAGAAFVFHRDDGGTPSDLTDDTWIEVDKVFASDASASDPARFGATVSISGAYAVVGAWMRNDSLFSNSGAAYVFRRDDSGTPLDPFDDDWVEVDLLVDTQPWIERHFGFSVSISGIRIAIGSPGVPGDEFDEEGAVFVFRRDDNGTPSDPTDDSWVEEDKLVASDAQGDDRLGYAVSMDGDWAFAGAQSNDAGTDSGSVYAFRRDDNGTPLDSSDDSWIEHAKLVAFDAAAQDRFGIVALRGDRLIVGAPNDTDGFAFNVGSAYLFQRTDEGTTLDLSDDTWTQWRKVVATDGGFQDGFGSAVSINTVFSAIGAPLDDGPSGDSGSSYIILAPGLPPEDCDNNGVEDACDLFVGANEDCNENDTPDVCDIADETSRDKNGNGVPDECDARCSVNQTAKLTAGDGAAGDNFGYSVSIDGDYAAIGAPFEDAAANNAGACYVFRRGCGGTPDPMDDMWVQAAKLTPSDGNMGQLFGQPPAVDGDYVAVGASGDDDAGERSGAVYLYRRNDGGTPSDPGDDVWQETAKLVADDAVMFSELGITVDVSGIRVVAGTVHAGAAYIFRRSDNGTPTVPGDDSWSQEQKLTVVGVGTAQAFGETVSIGVDWAAVGARLADLGAGNAGAVYVFRRDDAGTPSNQDDDSWIEHAVLVATDAEAGDRFGSAIGLDGDRIIVGAKSDGDAGQDSGSGYIFRRDANGTPANLADDFWIQEAKLVAPDADMGDVFGFAVALHNNSAAVGAPGDGDGGPGSGSMYIFVRDDNGTPLVPGDDTWPQFVKLTAADAGAFDGLGVSVSLSDAWFIAGAYDDDDFGNGSGSAYLRVLPGPDCNANNYPDQCDIYDETSTDLNNNAVPDDCEVPCIDVTECDDGDECTRDECVAAFCSNVRILYGDLNDDGGVDIFDILCVLDGFAGVFEQPCIAESVDLVPCPFGNDGVDIFDILAVLDAFAGGANCCSQ
ncbi:MAG: hypothetical protein HOP29_08465 [Phycisphaerales bacterium]|nr:hypothetical protein [Phycisphaerales bacterium]